jgi:hypothetical protein
MTQKGAILFYFAAEARNHAPAAEDDECMLLGTCKQL